MNRSFGDVAVQIDDEFVATIEIRRPPNNFFDVALIRSIAEALEMLDAVAECRAIVLCSEGRHFCAGAVLGGDNKDEGFPNPLYAEAVRLFATSKPVVAAVQGAAIGGGLGLACFADFRVGCPQSRFAASFARLGFHHGFGLTVTLPWIVSNQYAADMLYTGRRVPGDEALKMGLCDRLADDVGVRAEAHALAREVAASAPLAVQSIRATMRGHLIEQVRRAAEHEDAEQARLRRTEDWAEGVAASAQRRTPDFAGR